MRDVQDRKCRDLPAANPIARDDIVVFFQHFFACHLDEAAEFKLCSISFAEERTHATKNNLSSE
jgi:hypothetical protein